MGPVLIRALGWIVLAPLFVAASLAYVAHQALWPVGNCRNSPDWD